MFGRGWLKVETASPRSISASSRTNFLVRARRDAPRNDPSLVQKYNESKLRYHMMEAAQYRAAKGKFIEWVLGEL